MSPYLAPKQINPWSKLLDNDDEGDPIMPLDNASQILESLEAFHQPGGAPVVLCNKELLRSGEWTCSLLYWDAETPPEAYPGVFESSTGIFTFTGDHEGSSTTIEPGLACLLLTHCTRVD